jgi:hypothetical protein
LQTGEAYCITYKDEATLADNGLWYCADVATPSWDLIYTPTQLRADVGDGGGGPSLDPLYLNSLAVYDTTTGAVATFAPKYRGAQEVGYVDIAGGVATWTNKSGVWFTYQSGANFSCLYNQANAANRIGIGHPAVPNTAQAFDLASNTETRWLNGARGVDGATNAWAIVDSNNLYPYVLGADIPLGGVATYTTHTTGMPIDEAGGSVFWINNADDALMIGAAIQATPNDSGGSTGVFSNVGADSGGFIVIDTPATIIWAAYTSSASNAYRSIAITQDGGATWRTLDGDWAAKVGAAWAGGAPGKAVPYASYAQM